MDNDLDMDIDVTVLDKYDLDRLYRSGLPTRRSRAVIHSITKQFKTSYKELELKLLTIAVLVQFMINPFEDGMDIKSATYKFVELFHYDNTAHTIEIISLQCDIFLKAIFRQRFLQW